MNRGPGGQQPKMHNTIVPATGQPQRMVYPADTPGFDNKDRPLAGQAKGMEQVLFERGLLEELGANSPNGKPVGVCSRCKLSQEARDKAAKAAKARKEEIDGVGMGGMADRYECAAEVEDLEHARNCCMQRVLSLQSDFVNEKPLLQLVIEKAGHKCLFLPKFHCELNPIEMVWGQTKRSESQINLVTPSQFANRFLGFRELTDGTFPRAKELVPKSLDHISISDIRKYFRHCYRYMDAYR
jgi:transposase